MKLPFARAARESEEPRPALTISEYVRGMFGAYLGPEGSVRLNVGCANNREPGFINLDMDPQVHPDVVWSLEALPLPFDDCTFDCIFASHVLEHVERRSIIPLIHDFHRILKPGGRLIGITPYGGSDDAWEAPQHTIYFSEKTWAYFANKLYDQPNSHGDGARQGFEFADWGEMIVYLVPYNEFADDPQLQFKMRYYRNIVREVHAILYKKG